MVKLTMSVEDIMRILFTCVFLDGYHGSVMLVKEHAEYLASKRGGGHDVTVATVIATPEITDFFTSCGVAVRHLPDVAVAVHYDIVFAYHYPTRDNLLERGLHCEKLVMGSLSSFEKLESFPQYWDCASLLIVMSEETRMVHHSRYSIPLEKMLVFENNIPDAFAEYAVSCPSLSLSRVAVVSNHIPPEVEELKAHLPYDCTFTMIGMGREICEAVTPKLLSRFDVVISIGKTVQYAMALGIPVFEYDATKCTWGADYSSVASTTEGSTEYYTAIETALKNYTATYKNTNSAIDDSLF